MVVATAMVFALAACGSSDSGGSGDKDKGAIAMSFGGANVPVWNTILKMMRPKIEAAGYDFLTDDPQWDVAKQSSDWDGWLARGDLKAIMGFPIQVQALKPVSQRIVAKKIPLIGYGVKWEETSAAFLTDGYKDGQKLGKAAASWITDKYGADADIEVATFVSRDDDLSKSRADGYSDGLTSSLPNVKVREIVGLARQAGYDGTKSMLTAHPDIKVWIGAEDATLGAYQALTEKGVAKDDPNYFLGALDLTNPSLDLLKENGIFRTGFLIRPADVADTLVKLLLTAADGGKPEDIVLQTEQATLKNADEFYTD